MNSEDPKVLVSGVLSICEVPEQPIPILTKLTIVICSKYRLKVL